MHVVENGAKSGAAPPHGEGSSTALLAAMQEGFATLSGKRANAISEVFKSAKVELEISSDEETHKRKIDCYAAICRADLSAPRNREANRRV